MTGRKRTFPGWAWLPALLVALALLVGPFGHAAEQRRVTHLLDALEEGLEAYRSTHGRYPDAVTLTGIELAEELELETPLRNPWTRAPYGDDPFELDLCWYTAEESGRGCTLEALERGGERVVQARRLAMP